MGCDDGCESAAVTVETLPAPLSETDVGFSASVTVGATSSSVIVSVAPVTAMVVESAVARAFATVAVTVAVRSGASVVLSVAVTSAVSVPVVAPAAITMVASAPAPAVKAPATAATVSVVAAPEGCERVAVTVDTFPAPLSATLVGFSAIVTPGGPSSSVVVTSTSTFARPL